MTPLFHFFNGIVEPSVSRLELFAKNSNYFKKISKTRAESKRVYKYLIYSRHSNNYSSIPLKSIRKSEANSGDFYSG